MNMTMLINPEKKVDAILKNTTIAGLFCLVATVPFSVSFAEIGLGIALFAWLGRVFFTGQVKIKRSVITIPLLVFIGAAVISSLCAEYPFESLYENRFLLLSVIVFIVPSTLDKKLFSQLVSVWAIAVIIAGAFGVIQMFTGIDIVHYRRLAAISVSESLQLFQAHGTFDLHLTYGGSLALASLFLGGALLSGFSRKQRILLLCAGIIGSCGVIASFSRSAWLGFLAGFTALGFLTDKRFRFIIIVILIIVLLLFALIVPLRDHINTVFQEARSGERQYIWRGAMGMIRDNPICGIGSAHHIKNYWNYFTQARRSDPTTAFFKIVAGLNGDTEYVKYIRITTDLNNDYLRLFHHPHNDFLNSWLIGGILGFISYVWLLTAFIWKGIQLFSISVKSKNTAIRKQSFFLISGVSAIIAHCIMSLGQCYFIDDENALAIWLVIGMTVYCMQSCAPYTEKAIKSV